VGILSTSCLQVLPATELWVYYMLMSGKLLVLRVDTCLFVQDYANEHRNSKTVQSSQIIYELYC
jgi:hypothetical protein